MDFNYQKSVIARPHGTSGKNIKQVNSFYKCIYNCPIPELKYKMNNKQSIITCKCNNELIPYRGPLSKITLHTTI